MRSIKQHNLDLVNNRVSTKLYSSSNDYDYEYAKKELHKIEYSTLKEYEEGHKINEKQLKVIDEGDRIPHPI